MRKNIKIKFQVIILLVNALIMSTNIFSQTASGPDRIGTSDGPLEMTFIGHGSLMFNAGGFIIHIDPVSSSGSYDSLPAADLILVTHEHFDHLDVKLIDKLRKPGTLIYANKAAAAQIRDAGIVKAGDSRQAGKARIEVVEAYNMVNQRSPGQPFHPKGNGLGFVIGIGDKRIYVAGDTENIPEMKELKNIDIAFLPMNLPYTMTPEMVADAVLAFRPKILYPYHYGDTNTGRISDLLKDSGIEVRIRNLK